MSFDEWFETYSSTYSKDKWSLRDAWNAALYLGDQPKRGDCGKALHKEGELCSARDEAYG